MSTLIRNSPSLLVPKELFKEEKLQTYWNVFNPDSQFEKIGKDDLENFFLLYPKHNEEDTIHEITAMYQEFKEKFPNQDHAICINVYDEEFNLWVIKNQKIAYTGYFRYSVKEDVLYHLANISQQYFEDISQVVFAYQQLSPDILRLLENYFQIKKM